MLKTRIRRWISEGGSFRQGVGLLEMAGAIRLATRHRCVLKASSYVDAGRKKALRWDLVTVLKGLPDDSPAATPPLPGTAPCAPPPAAPQPPADTPVITALRSRGVNLLKTRSDLKGRLLAMSIDAPDLYSDEERYELASEIMIDNVGALDETYGAIRRFEREGIEPAGDAEQKYRQGVEDMREINSLRPRISRLRSAKKKGNDVDEAQLSELEARLEELELRTTLG